MIDLGKVNMNKESKILKNVLQLTNDNKLKWDFKSYSRTTIYSSQYNITEKKSIIISIVVDKYSLSESYIYFILNDDRPKHKPIEIKEIYPFNKLNVISHIYLNYILKKIIKVVKKKQQLGIGNNLQIR